MRIGKILSLILVVSLVSGCACRRHAGGSGDNIPLAEAGKDLKDVYYAFDSYALDSGAKSVLQANADWLKAHSSVKVQIEGHCDERGTNEYNMVLGENRARASYDFLRSLGISSDRMSTVSYGEELPLDPRHTEEAWAKNRRAHFNVAN